MKKLAILETGLTPQILAGAHGSFPDMIERWLRPVFPDASFQAISVVQGEALPQPSQFDGYILTGSRHGVYDNLPWMPPLKAFILNAAAARVPQLGICFGHQIMAEAFGGRVEKSARGWQAGLRHYTVSGSLPGFGDRLPVLIMHQDQVVQAPECAKILAGNEHCGFAMLQYTPEAISCQCHPEFSPAIIEALLDAPREIPIPRDVAEESRLSLTRGGPANSNIAAWAAEVFNARWDE